MIDAAALEAYFVRIAYSGPREPTLATLAAIHGRHVDAIPFEGLNPLAGLPVRLDLQSLQDKLVRSRRGGYCYEQNALFRAVLETLGFRVTPLSGRVRWTVPADAPLGTLVHMLLKVDLPEGAFVADVGFGVNLMDSPLRLAADVEQRTGMGTFRLIEKDQAFWLEARQPGGWRPMYMFTLQPQMLSDYEQQNWYAATHPSLPFVNMIVMERLAATRRYTLVNLSFRIQARDGEILENRTVADASELHAVLDGVFNVAPPIPAEALFEKIQKAAL